MTNTPTATEYLVLAGKGSDGKPHAARFPATEIAAVRKAAALMAMLVGKATDEAALKVVRRLPEGKIFAAGKALVPLVKTDLYDDLVKVVSFHDVGSSAPLTSQQQPADANEAAQGNVSSSPATPSLDLWTAIKVGSVVLCWSIDPEGSAWFECVVTAISKDGNTLTVRWRDYPKFKPFAVPRLAVSILAPNPPSK
jgi:hypothetical protein